MWGISLPGNVAERFRIAVTNSLIVLRGSQSYEVTQANLDKFMQIGVVNVPFDFQAWRQCFTACLLHIRGIVCRESIR
jgi:hypothetical protein